MVMANTRLRPALLFCTKNQNGSYLGFFYFFSFSHLLVPYRTSVLVNERFAAEERCECHLL